MPARSLHGCIHGVPWHDYTDSGLPENSFAAGIHTTHEVPWTIFDRQSSASQPETVNGFATRQVTKAHIQGSSTDDLPFFMIMTRNAGGS